MTSIGYPWIAGPEEAPTVATLLCEFRDWWGNSEPSDEAMLRNVEQVMAGGDGEFLLHATLDDEPAGVAQLRYRFSVWKTASDCWLEDLYVRDSARRQGFGRALVLGAVDRARSRFCRRIELDVNEDNEAALALYQACGFTLEPKPPGRTLFIARALR